MLFTRTIFADRNSIGKQWFHLFSEVIELGMAILRKDWRHVTNEAVDCQHSADTLLFIAKEKHGADSDGAYHRVDVNNKLRGYYGKPVLVNKKNAA